jgi:two-component system, LuxR family, sensor kinase FixL
MLTAVNAPKTLQAILDAAVDGVVLIDHRGIIEAFNRASECLFGYAAAEVLGQNVSMLMPAGEAAAHDAHIARYLRTGTPHIIGRGREVTARRRDGTEFPIFLSVGVVPGSDPPRFLGFVHDLTLRRNTEERGRLLQERLTHVSRLATLGEIASGIAHEVNQPLTAVANYAQACERLLGGANPDIEEIREALREISAQAVRAGDIVHRLRSAVRTSDQSRAPVNVNSLIGELKDLVVGDARRHNVGLHFELGENLPLVEVNSGQIQQILLSLLRNAFESLAHANSPAKQVTTHTRLSPDRDVEVHVCDNGPGVPERNVPRLFEPFFTTKKVGTGLGLVTSRSIAESHGGTLSFRPNVPVGACFVLRLPTL